MMNISDTLYVSDLDGTLLTPESHISPVTAALLNEAIDAGALFTIASARTPATVSQLLMNVKMRIPAIVMTGSALWNPMTGEYSNRETMSPQTAAELLEIYRSKGLPTFIYKLKNKVIDIYHIGEMTDLETGFVNERIGNPFKHFERVNCEHDGAPQDMDDIMLFYAMQPDKLVTPVNEILKQRDDVNPIFYHDLFGPGTAILEVFSAKTSKANAIKRLAADLGVKRIVAFGDNVNDIPMLRIADVAVAVEGAVDEVKEMADVIIGSNSDDSVARYIIDDIHKNCGAI